MSRTIFRSKNASKICLFFCNFAVCGKCCTYECRCQVYIQGCMHPPRGTGRRNPEVTFICMYIHIAPLGRGSWASLETRPAEGVASGLRAAGLAPDLLSAAAAFAAGFRCEAAASMAAAACRRLSSPFSAFILQKWMRDTCETVGQRTCPRCI